MKNLPPSSVTALLVGGSLAALPLDLTGQVIGAVLVCIAITTVNRFFKG
jgi:hypothetical protein